VNYSSSFVASSVDGVERGDAVASVSRGRTPDILRSAAAVAAAAAAAATAAANTVRNQNSAFIGNDNDEIAAVAGRRERTDCLHSDARMPRQLHRVRIYAIVGVRVW
jgi:hypothetical protein